MAKTSDIEIIEMIQQILEKNIEVTKEYKTVIATAVKDLARSDNNEELIAITERVERAKKRTSEWNGLCDVVFKYAKEELGLMAD